MIESTENDSKNNKRYKRWTAGDIERLKRIYNAAKPEKRSQDFIDKITRMYGEGRSAGSIQEECRRLGLEAKRLPQSPICLNEDCGIMLSPSTRVGNLCITCYRKSWWIKNKTVNQDI